MRSAGSFHPEWGYLAPAPSFMRTARVVLLATAVGATAGAAVVFSLVESPASDISKTSVASTSVSSHVLVTSVQAATPPTIMAAPVVDNSVPLASPASAATVTAATVTAVPATALSAPVQEPAPVQAKFDEPKTKTDQSNTDASAAVQPSAQPTIASGSIGAAVADGQPAAPAVSDASAAPKSEAPASVAALAEAPPAPAVAPAQVEDETTVAPDAPPPQKKLVKRHVAPTHYAQRSEPGYYSANVRGRPADDVGLAPLLRRLFSARSGFSSN